MRRLMVFAYACAVFGLAATIAWLLSVVDAAVITRVMSRTVSGLAWTSWFGSTVSWPALKAHLRRLRVPATALTYVDVGILHGGLLLSELMHRREAARVRLGAAARSLNCNAQMIAAGIVSALIKSVTLAEARELRLLISREG